jgi:hypothetical protein
LATIQDCQSRWFLSSPTIGSAIIYAAVVGFQMTMMSKTPLLTLTSVPLIKHVAVAAIVGIAAGMVRERSHSVLPAWLFQALAVATLLLVYGPV